MQVAQVFDPVSLDTIRPWAFSVWRFFYLLPYFFNFNIYVILHCQLSQFIFHLSQPICVFSVCHCLVRYITPKTSSSASGITLSLRAPSNSLNNLFWFDSNNQFCLHCFVLLSYLSSFAPTVTNLCRTSLWTTSAPFLFTWTFKLWYDVFIL